MTLSCNYSILAAESSSWSVHQSERSSRDHFGYEEKWWPGTPLEIAITAILVQRSDWSKAWEAANQLKGNGLLQLLELADANESEVRECLAPISLAGQKSPRLILFAQGIQERGYDRIEDYFSENEDTKALRQDLLSFKGIGEETADCILLFASDRPSFVVDASTRRVFERMAIFPELSAQIRSIRYQDLQQFIETHILSQLSFFNSFRFVPNVPNSTAIFRDFHALILEVAKHHCLSRNPRCKSTGRPGWTGYDICETHCLSNVCTRCPLIERCAMGNPQIKS